jgi:pilus assembly protein CpaB
MTFTPESIKKALPLLLIGFIALCAGLLVFNYLNNSEARLQKEYASRYSKDLVEVIVAAADLPSGSATSSQSMAIRKIPRQFLPAGFVQPGEVERYFGRKLLTAMPSGTPLSRLFIEDTVATPFSTKILPGQRALTLPVDEINSISGLLRAGDRLDLYITARPPATKSPDTRDEQVVFPVIQNLLVHATGQLTKEETDNRNKLMADNSNMTRDRYATITVAVGQFDAQRLILAQQMGKITAVLRNPADKGGLKITTSSKSLFDNALGLSHYEDPSSITYFLGGNGIKKVTERTEPKQ